MDEESFAFGSVTRCQLVTKAGTLRSCFESRVNSCYRKVRNMPSAAQTGDAADLVMGRCRPPTAPHYSGDGAGHHIDRALAQLVAPAEQPQMVRVRFQMRTFDALFPALASCALVLQRFAEQALRVVAD